jgi:predicted lipoprotein with Yx(FWY)xxD motif
VTTTAKDINRARITPHFPELTISPTIVPRFTRMFDTVLRITSHAIALRKHNFVRKDPLRQHPSRFEVEMKHVEHLDKNTPTRKGTNVQSSHIDRKRATVAGLTLAVLVLVVVVIVVVQGSKKSPATSTQRLRPEVVLKTHQSSKHGTYLVNDKGFTLYTYQLDTDDHSYCVNYCLHMWPALTVAPGRSPVAHGVSDLGFITRSSGVHQVTYKGHPLYTFQIDVFPGQTLGNHGPWSIVRISKTAN